MKSGRCLALGFLLWLCSTERAVPQERVDKIPQTITNSIGMTLVRIEPGEFWMGMSTPTGSRHKVRITKPFSLGKYEVTKGEFRKFVEATNYHTEAEQRLTGGHGFNAAGNKWENGPQYTWQNPGWTPYDDTYPVVNVTWNDAQRFCKWLSTKEKATYRLPTEAEWEYACRAGTETLVWSGDSLENLPQIANVPDGTAKERFSDWPTAIEGRDGYVFAAPVGKFPANPWGLHDMLGNVGEWTADVYDANAYRNRAGTTTVDPHVTDGPTPLRRVWRGGFFYQQPAYVRSATRFPAPPDFTADRHGFRVVVVPASLKSGKGMP